MTEVEQRRTGWWSALRRLLRSAGENRTAPMAGEAAFFAALAVFPALLTIVAVVRVLGAVLGPGAEERAARGLTALLTVVLTPQGGVAEGAAEVLLAAPNEGGILTASTAVALFLMARALRSVHYALGLISDAPPRRVWPAAVGLASATLVGAGAVIAITVTDPLTAIAIPAETLWAVLRWPFALAGLVAWAALLLRVGSGRHVGRRAMPGSRRALVIGSLCATGGWIVSSALLPVYVQLAGRLTPTVGALGGGLILLLWLYLLVLALYFAAEIRTVLDSEGGGRSRPQ